MLARPKILLFMVYCVSNHLYKPHHINMLLKIILGIEILIGTAALDFWFFRQCVLILQACCKHNKFLDAKEI